ncbi:competence/damage-inducible protein A [Aestuariispira insulae]|uniref:Molybdenum cofactor synthesis domain-containing protein n=1 Tax=Aestuariispira insulae TaxID=1461337 RepID=A0A3D9HS44_9PROT|nr:competence/damage-inducible protein A [Aestuariispira insulae]RED52279.1 molybdenum cofactor synthesis domain-containing protein [Aestuariispira insulae]
MTDVSGDVGIVTAALVVIGNEILSGRTQDVNLSHIAEQLESRGIRLAEARVVPDNQAAIIEAVNALRSRNTYVFTTGGIGPTHDDITAESVAKAFDLPLTRHEEAYARLVAHYDNLGVEINEARARMAMTPEGADLIDNPVSGAPGFRIGNVHVMAGVPKIMHAMLETILPTLKGGDILHSRTVFSSLPEGEIAAGLGNIQAEYPDVEIGSYPAQKRGEYRLSLVLRGSDPEMLDRAGEAAMVLIDAKGGQCEMAKGQEKL